MRYLLLCLFLVPLQALGPENPYKDITRNKVWAMGIREKMENERIDRLLKTIRVVESNNRYHVRGSSGEYGAYQFMPTTWDLYCYMYMGKRLDIRVEENQDMIARFKIEDFINRGYKDEQIAAFWNSGRLEGWESLIGVNSHGASYNVPRYVERFMRVFYMVN